MDKKISIGIELSDEELMEMLGGTADVTAAVPQDKSRDLTIRPMYGIYSGPRVQPLYGIKPVDKIQPLYGIITKTTNK